MHGRKDEDSHFKVCYAITYRWQHISCAVVAKSVCQRQLNCLPSSLTGCCNVRLAKRRQRRMWPAVRPAVTSSPWSINCNFAAANRITCKNDVSTSAEDDVYRHNGRKMSYCRRRLLTAAAGRLYFSTRLMGCTKAVCPARPHLCNLS